MPTYNIERWDPVIPSGHTQPLPMIYIKPDETLLNLAKDNDYNVIVTISGTGKLYDTKPIPAVIDSSGYYPNFRPNFHNKHNYVVLTLMCDWLGYGNLGSVCVHGFTGSDSVKLEFKEYEPPKPLPWISEPYKKSEEKNEENLSSKQITLILLAIVIFLMVFASM
jgi:hypothetical protein